MRCAECAHEWDPAPEPLYEGDPTALLPQFRCPECQAAGAEVLAGNELLVDSIDVSDPDAEAEPDPAPALNGNGAAPDHQPQTS